MGEPERGEAAPRRWVSFWCANKHETRPGFAADAAIPETWECPQCGNPAGQNEQDPPARPRTEPYKTHLAYVKERRSDSDGEAILAEALARLRGISSTRPPVPDPPLAVGGEGRDGLRQREPDGGNRPVPAPAPPAPAARAPGPDAQQAPPPARRRGPARSSPDRAGRDHPGPARHAGEGPGGSGHVPGPARADSSPDLVAEDAVAARPVPKTAESCASTAEPTPTGPPAGGRCDTCEYLLDAPGHRRVCLGQW
jgi:hypothetical protein